MSVKAAIGQPRHGAFWVVVKVEVNHGGGPQTARLKPLPMRLRNFAISHNDARQPAPFNANLDGRSAFNGHVPGRSAYEFYPRKISRARQPEIPEPTQGQIHGAFCRIGVRIADQFARFPDRRNARAFEAAPEAEERPKFAVGGRWARYRPG